MIVVHDIGQLIVGLPRRITEIRNLLPEPLYDYQQRGSTWDALDVYLVMADAIRLERPYTAGGTAWANWGSRPGPNDPTSWRKAAGSGVPVWCSVSCWPGTDEMDPMVLRVEPGNHDYDARLPMPKHNDYTYVVGPFVVQQFVMLYAELPRIRGIGGAAMALDRAGYQWDNEHGIAERERNLSVIRRLLMSADLYQDWP